MEEWQVIKDGELVETASCIYDACDKVAMVEFPSEEFIFKVDYGKRLITIM